MKYIRKWSALLTAALLAAAPLRTALSASAAQVLLGYYGDVNQDSVVNVADAVLLSRYISGEEDILTTEAALFGDFDSNTTLDVIDLTRLKRVIANQEELTPIYTEVEEPQPSAELISPPIQAVNPTLPSVGNTRILMVAVNFPDCQFESQHTADAIHDLAFGPEDTSSPYYPLESISAYFDRASYGRLHMEGDVYTYTVQNSISSYVGQADSLVDEVLAGLDSQIDYSIYDSDDSTTLDTLILAIPGAASADDWWPCSGGYYGGNYYDGVIVGNLCMGTWDLNDVAGFNSTWVHELGHAMGLPDYYKYENTEDGYYGLNGDAGLEMMDDAFGDFSAFSKLMLGWYTADEAQMYSASNGSMTYTLQSSQDAPGCIIIPRVDGTGYRSEYFIIEYATYAGNNLNWQFSDQNGGIRILHCQAEVKEGYWGPELRYNNYGQDYDNSNQKQRVLRLVNEGNGFFHAGDVVNNSVSGFAWYDDSGYRTVDPNLSISLDSLENGVYTITITDLAE